MPTPDPFPNATINHQPDTKDLRTRLEASNWTHAELALLAGVTVRTIDRYLSHSAAARGHAIPYPLQFTLEAIARRKKPAKPAKRKPKNPQPTAPAPSWRDRLRAKRT